MPAVFIIFLENITALLTATFFTQPSLPLVQATNIILEGRRKSVKMTVASSFQGPTASNSCYELLVLCSEFRWGACALIRSFI